MSSTIWYVSRILGLMIGFCTLDAVVDILFFTEQGFLGSLLQPPTEEFYMRTVVCAAMTVAAIIYRVTDRRRYQLNRALVASELLYRDVVESCPDSIIIHRGDRLLYLNDVALKFLGVPDISAVRSSSMASFIHPDDREFSQQRRAATINGTGDVVPAIIRILLPGDKVCSAMVSSSRIMFEDEPAVLTFCRDITEEIETRNALTTSQDRLSLAVEAAQDGIWDWDMVSNILHHNRAWARMLGLESLDGTHTAALWTELVHPDDRQRGLAAATEHIDDLTPIFETEIRLRHAEGHYIWVLDRGQVVERSADGQPLRMAGTHRDITARKTAEIALEVRNKIAEVFLTSPRESVFINILPLIGKALESPVALLGILEANHKVRITSHDITTAREHDTAEQQMTVGTLPGIFKDLLMAQVPKIVNDQFAVALLSRPLARAVTIPILSKDNAMGFLMVGGRETDYDQADVDALVSLTGYLAPILDFHLESEVREGQLRQAQKMEAIGALAGGIAHDFNNILQAILGFSTLALEEAQEMHSQQGGFMANDLERVVRATQRGRELVNRILLFSRRQEQEQKAVSIAEVIDEAVGLLANTIPATIRVQTDLEANCGPVLADPAQISQVLMNLATNAFHAMENTGGVLTFKLRSIGAEDSDPLVPPALSGRPLVVMTVGDTGCGMDPATLDRLYDPFFTTKEVDKGTGLGLSVVHGIVTAHGGEIIIESALGRGTTAHVLLPLLIEPMFEPANDRLLPASAELSTRIMPGKRILFLDDEPDIAALGKALLEKQGHQVLALDDGRIALEHLRQAPADFDLLITDLTMPHMTGVQIADEVERIRPELPVVLITGLNDLPMDQYHKHPQIQGVLRKPFGGQTLRDTVNEVLNWTSTEAEPPERKTET